uniref:Uncharacterized protein n=1 Tax=Caenorhabditis japonica TaxID=281687 RepID=A0A8R1E5H2_CAEJA
MSHVRNSPRKSYARNGCLHTFWTPPFITRKRSTDHITMYYFLALFLVAVSNVESQSYNDVICRRPWYFNSPRPAPLIICVILLILLLLVCCCCCVAWLTIGRKKKTAPEGKNAAATKKDSQIQTVSGSTMDSGTQWEMRRGWEPEKRRSYAAATTMERDVEYKYFS